MSKDLPDIHVADFCEIIAMLEPMPPFTRLYDCWGSQYPSQKAHMVHWFSEQSTNGGGEYTRRKPNESTRTAYNRLLNPGALLWIAEALGENKTALEKAQSEAEKAEQENWRKSSKVFREHIPFDRIMELIGNSSGWMLDKEIVPLMVRDEETGEPYVPEDRDSEYQAILEKEFGL